MLTEVNLALDRVMSLEDLLELILDRAFEHFGPEDAAIYPRNDRGGYDEEIVWAANFNSGWKLPTE